MTQTVIHLETAESNGRRKGLGTALGAAIVAGAFVFTVSAVMLTSYFGELSEHPLTLPEFERMRLHLLDHPEDEATRARLRQFDVELRQGFFERRAFMERGRWLLLAGAIVVAVSAKLAYRLGARPYLPDAKTNPVAALPRVTAISRRAVGVAALVTVGVFVGLSSMPRYRLPSFAGALDSGTTEVVAEAEVTPEMHARNWPMFRGPSGDGIVAGGEYPTDWDGETGRNVLWKVAVPLAGKNSPVVWGDRVFLTGATETRRELYCFDARTGALRWKQAVGGPPPAGWEIVADDSGYAPSTVATDGKRVYAIFPTGDLAAFDFDGKRLWIRNLGIPKDNTYGHASSLLTWRERVIVQYDQGHAAEEGHSVMLAIEGASGEVAWEAKREVGCAWSTPIVAETPEGAQIIAVGMPWVMGHDAETGREIWRVKSFSGVEVAPSPVYADGLVFACVERADLVAIRVAGAKGDVTKTHVAWMYPDGLPDIVSPLAHGGMVFMVTTHGTLTMCEGPGEKAASGSREGKEVWSEIIEETEFNASPTLAGGKIYLPDLKGVTHILEAGREFKVVAEPKLGEPIRASPAFVDGKIFIRGDKHLYCIGSK